MKKVCISLEGLFNQFGKNLTHGKIENSEENYFDFYDNNGKLCCMDGEECFVKEENEENNYITLVNKNGEYDTTFKLSLNEFETACFVS